MVVFNPLKKEIDIKVVYYGPALCGKTTNLQSVHLKLNPQQRGELISLATKDDRTLFFDFLPIQLDNIKGFKTRFHIYTVPGQVFYTLTRKAVLTGVDGVIFVADSQEGKMRENVESLNDLKDNLKYYNKTLDSIPLVFQYNKRDLPVLIPLEEMNAQLNGMNAPFFEACAVSGKGVMEALTRCCKMVLQQIQSKSKTERVPGRADSADAYASRTIPEAELPQLALVERQADDNAAVAGYADAGAQAAASSEGAASGGVDEGVYAHDEMVVHESLPQEGEDEYSESAHFSGEETDLEANQPAASSMVSRGFSLKKEEDGAQERRGEKRLPVTGAVAPSGALTGEDEKRTCPRCSLKFKPNVKQCPICRINLVPEEKAAIEEAAEVSGRDHVHHAGGVETGVSQYEDPAPHVMLDTGQLEIVSCGQPQKASPHAIKIPVIMRLNPGKDEVKIELTISFGNGVSE